MKGKHTEESKKKISESIKKWHAAMTEEQKRARAEKIKATFQRLYSQMYAER